MILIFLVILGILAFAILAELERDRDESSNVSGHCPICGCEAEGDWLLCPHCRALLKSACPQCGHAVARYHAFCTHCGTRRAKEAQ